MPNLIHSLDASNIHLFIHKLKNEPVYTIHDCFATTANNMGKIENYVKEAFIEIYFKDGNYLEKMHNHILEQIKAYTDNEVIEDNKGDKYIKINDSADGIVRIPDIPQQFISNQYRDQFIKGIFKSIYFIK